jgi:hypothetical protein
MIEQEIILLIMNCKKYEKKAAFQKKTWLPKIPNYIKYYHLPHHLKLPLVIYKTKIIYFLTNQIFYFVNFFL